MEMSQMSDQLWLTDEQLEKLTGRKSKSKQIEYLKRSGIPFRVNATGHPVVTRSAVEGKPVDNTPRGWQPRVVGA